MSSAPHDWILMLAPHGAPDGAPGPEPACSAVTIAVATAVLGPGPVAWAVRTALEMTEENITQIPELGGGPMPFASLRSSVESTVLLALRGLLEDLAPRDQAITEEAVAIGAEFARRGIRLDRVLRGMRIGHARLHQSLAAAVATLPQPDRRAESRRVSDLLFAYADTHAGLVAEAYLAERARWQADRTAERRRVVERLLTGEDVPVEAASTALGYELDRHHQAFVVVADRRHTATTGLQRYVEDLGRALAADGWLALPAAPGRLSAWAWAGWRAEPAPGCTDRARQLPQPPGIRVAAGPVAYGPKGLRRSHLGAREAARVAAPHSDRTVRWCDYVPVRTLSLATADHEQARWYAEDILGSLLADDERTRELRETLRVYLDCERSPQTAANKLHIARNTVTYRVHKAEELLGHPIGDPMELRLALEIARTPVRDPPPGP